MDFTLYRDFSPDVNIPVLIVDQKDRALARKPNLKALLQLEMRLRLFLRWVRSSVSDQMLVLGSQRGLAVFLPQLS